MPNTQNKKMLCLPLSWLRQFPCTLSYIILVVLINSIFVYAPTLTINGSLVSMGDIVVGAIYILRDFAQREVKHYVIVAMLIGCFFSYIFADKHIAIASLCAFAVGETLDWVIFTWSRKPLSERLLWSSCISVPIDSIVFLYLSHLLNAEGLLVLTLGKFAGIFILWCLWRMRASSLIASNSH